MSLNDDFLTRAHSEISAFCEERDWDQFHTPKDLAIGLVTEASELLELFRFASDEQTNLRLKQPEFREKVQDELADVLFFLIRFSQMNKFDLAEAFQKKMRKNKEKYPADIARGSNAKYNELKPT